jgi:hemerythrin-like metal-binding protein
LALIEWNDNLSVNVVVIDLQHQRLIQMINELGDAMSQGKGSSVVGSIVDKLIFYTDTHFKTEERYFDQHGYPETPAHKAEHKALVEKVLGFKEELKNGNRRMSVEITSFLQKWLTGHIRGSDKKYSQFMNDHGVF